MEKEENQNKTAVDQNQKTMDENENSDLNLDIKNKQKTDHDHEEDTKELSPEEKISELEDKVARSFAEMENQRRRFEKEKEDAFEYGGYSFAKEALNLIDNLDRSKHVLKSDEKLKETEALTKTLEHLDIIKKDLISIFEKNNIKPIESLNKKLDPNFHQAMMEIEDDTKEALNLIDNLDRSRHVLESDEKLKETEALTKTLEHLDIIKKDIISIFEKNNIKPIESLNKKLDPNFHQAMMEIEDDTKEAGTIIQEIQKGFTIKDRLLRPSLVGVSKKVTKKQEKSEENDENSENK